MHGESKLVTFYATYVANVNMANVTFYINEDDLLEAVLEK